MQEFFLISVAEILRKDNMKLIHVLFTNYIRFLIFKYEKIKINNKNFISETFFYFHRLLCNLFNIQIYIAINIFLFIYFLFFFIFFFFLQIFDLRKHRQQKLQSMFFVFCINIGFKLLCVIKLNDLFVWHIIFFFFFFWMLDLIW